MSNKLALDAMLDHLNMLGANQVQRDAYIKLWTESVLNELHPLLPCPKCFFLNIDAELKCSKSNRDDIEILECKSCGQQYGFKSI